MPTLRLDGDASGAVKATSELNKKVKEVAKSFDLTAREAKKLETAAAQIVRANEGPQDRYNRKVAELSKLFVAGKLSVEQMDRALARRSTNLPDRPAFNSRPGSNNSSRRTSKGIAPIRSIRSTSRCKRCSTIRKPRVHSWANTISKRPPSRPSSRCSWIDNRQRGRPSMRHLRRWERRKINGRPALAV